MLSRSTGISIGNIHSMRRASAPTIVSDDVNRIKNPFPDLGKALAGPEGQMDFMLDLQKKVMEGIQDVTGKKLPALGTEQPKPTNSIEHRLDRMHQVPVEKLSKSEVNKVISPKSLFNDALINKR